MNRKYNIRLCDVRRTGAHSPKLVKSCKFFSILKDVLKAIKPDDLKECLIQFTPLDAKTRMLLLENYSKFKIYLHSSVNIREYIYIEVIFLELTAYF